MIVIKIRLAVEQAILSQFRYMRLKLIGLIDKHIHLFKTHSDYEHYYEL